MRIGELAKLRGLDASKIRFYETMGLIKAVKRKPNGYRDYTAEALMVLEIIVSAQNAGFSLKEARHLLPMAPDSWDHDELLEALRQKVAEIESLQKTPETNPSATPGGHPKYREQTGWDRLRREHEERV